MTTESQNEFVHAYTETDTGAIIRLRGYETDNGWMEAVEVVEGDYDDDDTHVTTIYEGRGLKPTAVYNHTILPFLDEEEEEA